MSGGPEYPPDVILWALMRAGSITHAAAVAGLVAAVVACSGKDKSAPNFCSNKNACNSGPSSGAGGDTGAGGAGGAAPGVTEWAKAIGDAEDQHASRIALDSKGNVIVTGYFAGALVLDAKKVITTSNPKDLFVAALDAKTHDGLWGFALGDTSAEPINSDVSSVAVAVSTKDEVFVAAEVAKEADFPNAAPIAVAKASAVIAKLSPTTGEAEWAKQPVELASATSVGDLAVDGNGGLAMVGNYSASAKDWGIYVARLDSSGTVLWVHNFMHGTGGAISGDLGNAVTFTTSGDVVAVGDFVDTIVDPATMATSKSSGQGDAFIARLDGMSGAVKWTHAFGGPSNDRATAVAALPMDGVAVAGSFVGSGINIGNGPLIAKHSASADMWVAGYDAMGTYLWQEIELSDGNQVPRQMRFGADNRLALIGDFTLEVNFGTDVKNANGGVFVAKLDPAVAMNKPRWAVQFGDQPTEYARGIATGAKGESAITCDLGGSITSGKTTFKSQGKSDVFVALVGP